MNSPDYPEFENQAKYDEIKFCQWCGIQLNKIGEMLPVKCPECHRKAMPEITKPYSKDCYTEILLRGGIGAVKGVFSMDTYKRLRDQLDYYDRSDLVGME